MLRVAGIAMTMALAADFAAAQENAAGARPGKAYGQRIVLTGSVTPTFERDLMLAARECQKQAVEQNNESVLVIEIHRGKSKFGSVFDVAKFLISQEIARVRTVAWIPKGQKIEGNNVILALACRDIVMHPDGEIGNIGDGVATDADIERFVRTLVDNRHNKHLSWAIAKGMLDPQAIVKKVKLRPKPGADIITRIVTEKELQDLRARQAEIPDEPVLLKDAGVPGVFSGSKADSDGILIAGSRKSLEEVAAMYNVTARSLRPVPTVTGKDKRVAYIRVDGMIEPIMESFMQRLIDRCIAEDKNLIIFEITSPGGYLVSSESLATRIRELDPKKIKTIAYIPRQALSGATIVALACDEIYLKPDAQIGDAGPIHVGEGGQFERAPEKILSSLKATMRSLAEKKQRPPALLEAMCDKDLEVYRVTHRDAPGRIWYMSEVEIEAAKGLWIKGPVVPESKVNDLLTLTGTRAKELGLAEGVIEGESHDDQMNNLKAALGLPAETKLIPLERTWVDSLVFWLNTKFATVMLLVIAIICIYLELQMTTGLLGIISALCFALFFWSRFLGGTATWLEVVLFLLGLGCIAMEIFVIPGFGVFGISGGLMLIASLVLASQTFGNLEPHADMQMLSATLGNLAICVVLVVAIAMALARYLPKVPFFNQLILAPPVYGEFGEGSDPRLRPEHLDESMAIVGKRGVAISVLRPAGKAEIDGRFMDVVSDGPFIPANSPIEVVQVSGNRVVVRSTETPTSL